MATSPVDVCNTALKRLGADSIVDFTEGTDRAALCAQLYQPTVDRCLREHPWNFAQFRVTLAPLASVPAFGYAAQFALPTLPLCLKVNRLDPAGSEYDIENTVDSQGNVTGKVIVCNEPLISIRYTGRIEDVTLWDASFTDYVAMSLAAQMAQPLTETASLSEKFTKMAAEMLSHARSADSQEGSTKQADINTLVDVRRHGFEEWSRNRNSI
jgi:hypothetical protein